MKTFAIQQPRFAFESVSIEVFAGEMNDNFFAGVKNRFAERGGRELRIATRVVGDGNPVNGRTLDELVGEGAGFYRIALDHRTAHGNEFSPDEKSGGLKKFFVQCLHWFNGLALFINTRFNRFSGFSTLGKPLKRLETFRVAEHPVETGC